MRIIHQAGPTQPTWVYKVKKAFCIVFVEWEVQNVNMESEFGV